MQSLSLFWSIYCIEMEAKCYAFRNMDWKIHDMRTTPGYNLGHEAETQHPSIHCVTVPLENLSELLHSAETEYQCSGPVVPFVSVYQLQQSAGLALHIHTTFRFTIQAFEDDDSWCLRSSLTCSSSGLVVEAEGFEWLWDGPFASQPHQIDVTTITCTQNTRRVRDQIAFW